jgi:hypothetical protein
LCVCGGCHLPKQGRSPHSLPFFPIPKFSGHNRLICKGFDCPVFFCPSIYEIGWVWRPWPRNSFASLLLIICPWGALLGPGTFTVYFSIDLAMWKLHQQRC